MQKSRLIYLFERYTNSTCTDGEKRELFEYISKDENAEHVKSTLGASLDDQPVSSTLTAEQKSNILGNIFAGENVPTDYKKERTLRWIKVASIVIFLFSATLFLMSRQTRSVNHLAGNVNQTVHPGGNRATLTLSNGQRVNLNDQKNGIISRQGNAKVIKLADGQLNYYAGDTQSSPIVYNTVSTPRGGKYDLILADGTRVWLNAASSITYPVVFSGTDRTVRITGEAYFEVAHDKTKPFRVTVEGQTVEVLGTHFNINGYTDEAELKTTLLEGKVKVAKGAELAFLRPGQQAVIQKNQAAIVIKDADTEEAIAWKNGLTSFKDAGIKAIMRQVSRWYDIDVEYKGEVAGQRLFTGEIPRNAELSEVLKVLELSNIHFTANNKKIIVDPN
jgi:ferric-dicitrate binding protein FerR (iron transport regulator)